MLELEHIQKSFDGVPVLKDISLQVADGEIVSILGPSGCGKTTLLNLILGIVDADSGRICYDGQNLTRTPMEKRGFNIVFQDYALFPNLNVLQNITYGLRNKPGISTKEEVEEWPYQTEFSLEHFQTVLSDSSLLAAYGHSLLMALLTAAAGTLIAYGAALITARSSLGRRYKRTIESIALVTNAIPGMVLGVAYLFLFSGTSLQNTLLLMVLCNIVHYFSTPYLMMKNALSKMNAGWETTAMLMGDSWLKTILRVVTPNALSSLIEVFSYYFINSMVTISALIFIAGARTMVLTTMIKQLQYVNRFNEVFVLSLLILATNLAAKALFSWLAGYRSKHSSKTTKKEGIL